MRLRGIQQLSIEGGELTVWKMTDAKQQEPNRCGSSNSEAKFGILLSMRKRVGIAVIAVVILGLFLYVLSQPKKGSVEWHKRAYLAAWKRLNLDDWRSRFARFLNDKASLKPDSLYPSESERGLLTEKIASHRRALVRLRYLTEKVIVVSDAPDDSLVQSMPEWPEKDSPFLDFEFISDKGTNGVLITGPVTSIEPWEKSLRTWVRFYIPKSGK